MQELHAIQTVNTTIGFEGWIRINCSSMLSNWIEHKNPNNLVYISIQYENQNSQYEISTVDINYLLKDENHQPFITAYFKSEDSENHALSSNRQVIWIYIFNKLILTIQILILFSSIFFQHHRSKRSAQFLRPRKHHRRLSSSRNNPLTNLSKPSSTKSCHKEHLYVSFRELRWDDWIIAPSGFNAFLCRGTCNFPLHHNVAATNHAVIQTLAHLLISPDIPKPCCAPSKLQSIQLLYSQNETIYKLKKYRGMIVKECACQ